MAIGNIGGALTRLEGILASEFNNVRNNQGTAIIVDMVRQIASRADLSETNLYVAGPELMGGTTDITIIATPARLLACIFDNTEAAINTPVVYEATVTEGTTVPRYTVEMAASTMHIAVFPCPQRYLKILWSVLDGSALTNASTLSAANAVKGVFVYAA